MAADPGVCPHCGTLISHSKPVLGGDEAPPAYGDLSVCVECTGLMLRDHNAWVELDEGMLAMLKPEVRELILLAQKSLREVKAKAK